MKQNTHASTPPYTVTEEAVNLISEISAAIERYSLAFDGPAGLRLRKTNRIKTIRGSTAIEGNTLSEEQITAILDGKRVAAPKKEIDEVLGAAAAYEQIESVDPFSVKDLLKVHKLMMGALPGENGAFRTRNVGVIDSAGNVIHMAPPHEHVPALIKNLFEWLKLSNAHPLVKSCVFHYEFEFIHPFSDGNGRTGRYWQTAILGKWRETFYSAPIENIVWENQNGYYLAIRRSTLLGDSWLFIEFMLARILQTIKARIPAQKTSAESNDMTTLANNVGINVGVNVGIKLSVRERDLLELLRLQNTLTAARIAETYAISIRQAERLLASLKKKGFLKREGPPKSGVWQITTPQPLPPNPPAS